MNITHRIITATAALAAALVAHPSIAGLRQWEPSDYIQDNLVLHYDGIRNAGLAAAHDGAATAWVDLSPSGNDATLVNGPGASGYWGATGFVFPGSSNLWIAAEQTSLSGDFTMQVACDTTASVMQGTCSWPNLIGGYGKGAAGAADELTIFYHNSNKRLSTKFLNTYLDQYLPSWNYKYATLIRSGSMGSLFDGTTPTLVSTSKTGAIGSRVMVGAGMDNNLAGAEGRLFTGTIYSVRIYNDALTGDELAWNRALDEARFHSAAVPESAVSAAFVPDAVIASSIAGAEGMEAAGCHMVDDGGHVFRAAPSATVSGTAYACTGCTIATWDASLGAYGAAETRDGVFAVAVAPGDKVKITWQWAAASSSLDAGYVTDGLALRLDGIDNAGVGVHDDAATVWKDISGNDRDAFLYGNADGTSHWTKDGFYFNFNAVFATTATFAFGTQYTFEVLLDAKRSDWWNDTTEKDILVSSAGIDGGAIYYKAANAILCHRSNTTTGSAWNAMPGFYQLATVKYLAALRNGSKTALITGTTYPNTEYDVSNGAPANFVTNAWLVGSKNTTIDPTTWLVGGRTTAPANTTKGTVKSVRLYNRLLTEAELARNREVDEARFFDVVPDSNAVIVASSIAGLEGREPSGIYFPDGWTFSAGTGTQSVRGIEWECAGYQLQTWDAATSTWGAQTTYESSSYTSPAVPFASVRLTWLWEPVSGVRTAADYALADYATGGVALHLDGLAHGNSATVWSDLSGHGRDATFARYTTLVNDWTTDGGAWTDDGFAFDSDGYFATDASFGIGRNYTMQILADWARKSENTHHETFLSPKDGIEWGSVWYKNGDGDKHIFHETDKLNGSSWNNRSGIVLPTTTTYLTALRDGLRSAIVTGTAYPTGSNTSGGTNVTKDWFEGNGTTDAVTPAQTWSVGGLSAQSNARNANPLTGTVKSVRLYDRMLTEDELAWNRSVDSARFFGALAATNVVVVANEFSGLATDTAYEVFGAHTFAASPSSVDGSSANFVRVQALQSNGTWMETARIEGGSYDYTPAAGTVRIEFRKSNPFVMVVR